MGRRQERDRSKTRGKREGKEGAEERGRREGEKKEWEEDRILLKLSSHFDHKYQL